MLEGRGEIHHKAAKMKAEMEGADSAERKEYLKGFEASLSSPWQHFGFGSNSFGVRAFNCTFA